MKPSLYIETSVVSYLTARPSGRVIAAARQQHTLRWWSTRRSRYDLFISPLVLAEAELGDPAAAAARLEALRSIEVVAASAESDALAEALLREVPLPEKATADANHIAVATVSGADYLLTWNFKHIANPVLREQIAEVGRTRGYRSPTLCSPEELLAATTP